MAKKPPRLTIVADGTNIFLVFDGRQIAKRGQPKTQYAKQWIPLEPGVVARDAPHPDSDDPMSFIIVEINGERVH
jgi:hypothetical protein